MPRHPDSVITPNSLLREARLRMASPLHAGQSMSRPELADVVNAALDRLYPGRDLTAHYVDFRWIGKLERGETRWPSDERRTAIRHILGAATDTELGLYIPRRTAEPQRGSVEARERDVPGLRMVQDGLLHVGYVIDTLDAVRDLGSVSVDVLRRQLLGAAASAAVGALIPNTTSLTRQANRHATGGDVEAVREMIQMFSRADQRRGGGHGRSAVTQYLHTDVAALLSARLGRLAWVIREHCVEPLSRPGENVPFGRRFTGDALGEPALFGEEAGEHPGRRGAVPAVQNPAVLGCDQVDVVVVACFVAM